MSYWEDEAAYWESYRTEKAKERAQKEPSRVEYARKKLGDLGYETQYDGHNKCLHFKFNGKTGKIYPFTGWYSVKGIGSDRGIHKLIKELEKRR